MRLVSAIASSPDFPGLHRFSMKNLPVTGTPVKTTTNAAKPGNAS
jgi:hypothetical protein